MKDEFFYQSFSTTNNDFLDKNTYLYFDSSIPQGKNFLLSSFLY